MPELQSIDEVVDVPEPLEEAVSIPVEALMSVARSEMEKEKQIYVNIEMYDEVQRQLMRRGCHRTGRNPTVQSVMTMLQQTKQTKSGLSLRNNRLLSIHQTNRRIGACIRCTTAARCGARKTLETDSERPEEWCTSSNICKAT